MTIDARALALELSSKFGRQNVRRQLVIEGVGVTTAERLARGAYTNVPGLLLANAIQRAGEALKARAVA
jgi:hypothetical protein